MRSSIAGIISAFTFFCIVALDSNIKSLPPLGRFLDPFQGFWQNEVRDEKLPEKLTLPTMISDGTVFYDSVLVPHVYAENDHDLYLLQGYITARHRLWQMDFISKVASGRLSEILGDKLVDFDKGMRRQGLQYGAEQFVETIKNDKKMISLINAYCAGVNAYIDELNYSDYPVEYKFFNYKPEHWTPLKVGLVFKYIQYSLSGPDNDFENSNSLQLLGKKNFDLLFPEILPFQETIAHNDSIWSNIIPLKVKAPTGYKMLSGLRKHAIEKEDPDNGSNNWAISGLKTKTGNSILCNDPHLTLSLPSIWFSIQLTSQESNTLGMSIPGVPCIITGANQNIAWGVTSARRDDRDWYKILFQDKSQTHYLIDNYWDKAELRIEEIKVREKDPVMDTVRYTKWGPVVYDKSFGKTNQKQGYALRWSGHDPSKELKAIYKINKAKDYTEFNNALKYFFGPALNFAFISNTNTIAMNIQARFPNRWKEQGKFVLDGTRSDTKWQNYIPQEHNISIVDPKIGYVSSANEHPAGINYPYYTYGQYYEYYRNRRIHDLLDSAKDLTVNELGNMMNDNYSLFAEENLQFLLNHIDLTTLNDEEQSVFNLLRNWDYQYSPDEIHSIYFEEWAKTIMQLVWDEFHEHPTKSYAIPSRANTFYLLKNNPNFSFFDELETSKSESIDDLINESFVLSIKKVDKWKEENADIALNWSNYKHTKIVHLGRLPGFEINKLKTGGYKGIINAMKEKHGPSYRMLVEMTKDGPVCYQAIPGGQSGNPGSPYYDNMVPYFEEGKLFKVHFYTTDDFKNYDNPPASLLKVEKIQKLNE
ncbi:penicillin acylase family protein [Flammeovirga kamogawensis]|uniref:Penicillin acylase family protein n=1 Tax=Flammeovirga kamogawensis TaxID=373891 RepID=A0ABX8GWR2_9BACT|nr:penicillin acylase family protein [Flammeovirga kamogawensis]MBB6461274.1 penicillin amidase [Flammeovirga kamogawensis]QWG07833.1 penicillin acylase family protein [Flammeovirga kamogawensis]TRX69638.1 penicillin acylase family protein [Flammeovirga kamogawensis]